jgi:hypothetical protein
MIDFSDLQGVVADFAEPAPLVVNRPGVATVPGGSTRRVSGALTPVAGVVGSCWPVTGKSITLLEGMGQRVTEAIDIFTPTSELLIANDATSQPGDQVTWHGKVYEVIVRHDWLRGPFWHYVARMVRS